MSDSVLQQTFEHSPLRDPAAQIRLLEITAIDDSEGKNTPHCQLTARYLDQLPDHVAVSYTWGSPDDTCLIYVNGRPLVVRRNCRDVLQQSWTNNFRKRMWVDAICINQLDDDEKSHQVAMMGAIYKQAKQVNIWLDQAADNSDTLFDCISHHARWVDDVLRVATAILDPKASICPIGLACTCLDDHKAVHSCLRGRPAEQHAPAGTAMSVHFSPEDFLVFALRDQRQDGPYAKAVPDLVARRLGIAITKPGDQWSSYVQEQAIASTGEAH